MSKTWSSTPLDRSDHDWEQRSSAGKISCWAVGDVSRVRLNAWEVVHKADWISDEAAKAGESNCCTAIFSGPRARERAEAYADYLRGEDLLK